MYKCKFCWYDNTTTITHLYCDWLGRHGPSCNANTQSSFLNTRPTFSNAWSSFSDSLPSFWFSLKASKTWPSVWKAQLNVWNAWPRVLRQVLGRMFRQKEFIKTWSVKSTGLVESSVIKLFNLHFINNTCSYS